MISDFKAGDQVITADGTRAEFVRYTTAATAVISIGPDTRLADATTLRRT